MNPRRTHRTPWKMLGLLLLAGPFLQGTTAAQNPELGQKKDGHVWIAGRWETRQERIRRPGHWERVYVPPEYEVVVVGGKSVRRIRQEGHYERQWVEERIEIVTRRVWIPGRWVKRER